LPSPEEARRYNELGAWFRPDFGQSVAISPSLVADEEKAGAPVATNNRPIGELATPGFAPSHQSWVYAPDRPNEQGYLEALPNGFLVSYPLETNYGALARSASPRLAAPTPTWPGGRPVGQLPRVPEYLKNPEPLASSLNPLAPAAYIGSRSVESVRADFPILAEKVQDGVPLVWLDNAATTQKPQAVIDRLVYFYQHENSNVHRGAHDLAARSTDAFEAAREKVARFIGAASENIVFTRGTTEGVNLIAQSFVKPRLKPGDEIILTILEHHANIVPWQILAQQTGARLRVAPVDDLGQIIVSEYGELFNHRTRFVSVTHVSNALGTIVPIAELTAIAHSFGVPIAVDGAQSIAHLPINVQQLGVDFFVFSGHKIYGPTGIGVVYGTPAALKRAQPYQGGGNMIADVTFEKTVYQKPPQKFEAGTANIAGAVGLGAALDYVSSLGLANIAQYEENLLHYGQTLLAKIPGLVLIGQAKNKASVLSFVLEGRGNEEVGQHLSRAGIAVRAGHHCAQPIVRRFGLEGTVRPSLAFYNTPREIEFLAKTIKELA
jgi:cysteine desulfurase/selenocysteine lyase